MTELRVATSRSLLVLLITICCSLSFAFVSYRAGPRRPQRKFVGDREGIAARASTVSSDDLLLLSFDVVAKTTEWRISQGTDAAFSVWPALMEKGIVAGSDDWLRNKMRAVSPVMVSRPGCSLSCDYALLARLLIEEQELDQGASNGCQGKYGSKFHPQTPSLTSSHRRNNRGSRPLTVGEIAKNWGKGGCIGETLLTKYHVDYENPLPVIQQRIDELNQKAYATPEINVGLLDILENFPSKNIIVTIGHKSDVSMAQKALSSVGVSSSFLPPGEESIGKILNNSSDHRNVMLLPIRTTHGSTYMDVLENAPSGSTLFVFENSVSALEQGIFLFGDNMPRSFGMAQTIIGRNIKLSLNLPKWPSESLENNEQIAQQNEAVMNPWINLQDLSEFQSARIIST